VDVIAAGQVAVVAGPFRPAGEPDGVGLGRAVRDEGAGLEVDGEVAFEHLLGAELDAAPGHWPGVERLLSEGQAAGQHETDQGRGEGGDEQETHGRPSRRFSPLFRRTVEFPRVFL